MRTSLEYTVFKEEEYDWNKGKLVNRIKGREFNFSVTGCKTEKEHEEIINDFFVFLAKNNIESDGYCDYSSWEDAIRLGDEKGFSYLNIPVNDADDKEYIKDLYKEWKEKRK